MKYRHDIFQKFNIVINDNDQPERKKSKKRGRLNSKKKIKNFFDFVVDDLYTKAMTMFNQFVLKAQEHLSEDSNKELFNDILLLKIYLTNFRSIVHDIFPKSGHMTMSHNSIWNKNLLKLKNYQKYKKRIMVIDHEFASLNLIGYDIVNYMNETLFEYLPKYKFNQENYDFTYFYGVFKRYMEKFQIIRPELGVTLNSNYNIDQSEKYFTQLFCLNHLFWMLYSCVYLNFEKHVAGQGFNFLQHAVDRIKCYEMGMKKLDEINEQEAEEGEDDSGFLIYV